MTQPSLSRRSAQVWPGVAWQQVSANGIDFEVATMAATRPEGAGRKLAICLHGFPEHAIAWRHQAPLLASLGYDVWMPNLRGYGGTSSPQDAAAYSTATLIDDCAALIRVAHSGAAGATETLVLAHDWGGALAWGLAMRNPELVQRLIVCNLPHPACFARELRRPPQMLMSWYMFLFQLPRLPEWLLTRANAAGLVQMLRRTARSRSTFPPEIVEVYRANALRPGGMTAMLNWYRGARDGSLRRIVAATRGRVSMPTLLLWGDADAALSVRTTQGTEEFVPQFTLRILHGVSHWIQQEAPETVNAIIAEWLSLH